MMKDEDALKGPVLASHSLLLACRLARQVHKNSSRNIYCEQQAPPLNVLTVYFQYDINLIKVKRN